MCKLAYANFRSQKAFNKFQISGKLIGAFFDVQQLYKYVLKK